ncbi:MAG: hypothetical protein AB7N76_36775 [Planctomycetota bacterium]
MAETAAPLAESEARLRAEVERQPPCPMRLEDLAPGLRKASDALNELTRPWRELLEEDGAPCEAVRELYLLGALAWNAGVLGA